jgi:hypothetical protein
VFTKAGDTRLQLGSLDWIHPLMFQVHGAHEAGRTILRRCLKMGQLATSF